MGRPSSQAEVHDAGKGPPASLHDFLHPGTTKETTAAAEFARAKGATTIGLTVEPGSPLANACDHVVGFEAPYTTGVPIDAVNSNYSRIYQLVMGVVALTGGENLTEPLIKSLAALQVAIDKAQLVFAPLFDDYAPRFAKENVVYTVASGASYGAAYSFSICVLMEMQWINSQAIHANEFFHGPFEVLDKDRAFILMKGLDSTRALEDRTAINMTSSSMAVLSTIKPRGTSVDDLSEWPMVLIPCVKPTSAST